MEEKILDYKNWTSLIGTSNDFKSVALIYEDEETYEDEDGFHATEIRCNEKTIELIKDQVSVSIPIEIVERAILLLRKCE